MFELFFGINHTLSPSGENLNPKGFYWLLLDDKQANKWPTDGSSESYSLYWEEVLAAFDDFLTHLGDNKYWTNSANITLMT